MGGRTDAKKGEGMQARRCTDKVSEKPAQRERSKILSEILLLYTLEDQQKVIGESWERIIGPGAGQSGHRAKESLNAFHTQKLGSPENVFPCRV